MAKGFLYLVCLVLGVSGVAMIGGSIYMKSNFGDFSDLFSSTGVWIILASGVFVFLVSFVGCYGTKNQSKCALFTFFFVIFIFLVLQIIAAVMFSSYMGKLDDVAAGSETADKLKSKTEKDINDYIFSLYNKCCDTTLASGGKVGCCEASTSCKSPVWNSAQAPACFAGNEKNLGDGNAICVSFAEVIEHLDNDASYYNKLNCIDSNVRATSFRQGIKDWIKSNADYLTLFAAVLGGIELLCLFFSCFLMCQNPDEFYDDSV